MVNSEELTDTKEYLALWAGFRINRCRYNRARLYIVDIELLLANTEFYILSYFCYILIILICILPDDGGWPLKRLG
jgi:hypothetical protein